MKTFLKKIYFWFAVKNIGKAACHKSCREVYFFLFLTVLQEIFALVQLEKWCLNLDRLSAWRKQNQDILETANNQNNLQHRSGVLRWFIFISLKSRKLSRQIQRVSQNGRSDSTLIYILESRGLKFGRRREIFVSEIRVLPFLWKSICTWWNSKPLKSFCACSEEIC